MSRDRSLSVTLRGNVTPYVAAIRQAHTATRDFAAQAGASARQNRADWEQVGRTMTVAGLAMAAGLGVGVKKVMDFDAAMSAASAATKATATDLGKLREAAIEAGADTQYSATEAAQAITEMGKAGLSTADILGGGLKGALSLAAAGQMDVAQAAELSSVALTQFSLKGSDLSHVADLLAAGAGKAVGSVEDMGMALKQSGQVAAQTGLSIEETTAALAAFASKGLLGSDAGTSLKTMLQRLNPQSKEAAELMDELGLRAYDASGKFVGLQEYAGRLQRGMKDLSAEQRNAAMSTLFGSDAVRAASVLYEQGSSGIGEWTKNVNDAGFAADQAARLTDNLKGDLERLGGAFDTAVIKSGSSATAALRGVVQAAERGIDRFSALPGPVQAGAVALGAAATAATLVGGAVIAAIPKIKAFEASLVEMGIVSQATATRMLTIAKSAGIVTAAIGGIAVAGDGMQQVLNGWSGVDMDAVKSLDAFLSKGPAAADASGLMRRGFDDLGASIERTFNESAWIKVSNFADSVMFLDGSMAGESAAFFGQLDKALSGFVSSGRGQQAAAVFKRLADEANRQGIPIERLNKAFPQYTSALEQARTAQANLVEVGPGSVKAWDAQQDAATLAAAATRAAKTNLESYVQELKGLNSPALDAREAMMAWEESIDQAAESLKRNGKNIDATTDKGRDNTRALDGMARAAIANITAMQQNGAGQQELQGQLQVSRDALIKTAKQFGLSEPAAKQYADQVLRIPPAVTTTAKLDTSEALAAVARLSAEYRTLGHLAQVTAQQAASIDRMRGYAGGGYVSGPGTSTSDSIPARLSAGEFVVRAAAVDYYGLDKLVAINAMRFADGGLVPAPTQVHSTVSLPSDGWALTGSLNVGGSLVPLVDARIVRALDGAARERRYGAA